MSGLNRNPPALAVGSINSYAKALVAVLGGIIAALSIHIYTQPDVSHAKPFAPVLLGKLSNPNGGVVEMFELAGTPPTVFCVIAVSSSPANPTLYPVVSCLKK